LQWVRHVKPFDTPPSFEVDGFEIRKVERNDRRSFTERHSATGFSDFLTDCKIATLELAQWRAPVSRLEGTAYGPEVKILHS
jgi:hypothetical protein